MRFLFFPLLAATLLLGACKHDIQNEDAVKQAIMKHLAKRPDLTNMDVTVTSVAFRQDEADANVHFQAKGTNAPGTGLDIPYVLERKGSEWVVKGMASGAGHGGGGTANPHGMGGAPGASGSLPTGHPVVPPPGGHLTTPPPEPHK